MERVHKIDKRLCAVGGGLEECGIDRELRVDLVCYRSGNAERWPSASTDCPEQIRVLVGVGGDMGCIWEDDRYLEDVVST